MISIHDIVAAFDRNPKDNSAIDEYLYGIAGQEIADRTLRPGVWSKAFSDAEGNGPKAVANYIKLRVPQLKEEFIEELARQKKQRMRQQKEDLKNEIMHAISAEKTKSRVAVKCRHCKAYLYVPRDVLGHSIKCHYCGTVQLSQE